MLLLPSLRGGEWNTEPEWHLERSARTMLDISVKKLSGHFKFGPESKKVSAIIAAITIAKQT